MGKFVQAQREDPAGKDRANVIPMSSISCLGDVGADMDWNAVREAAILRIDDAAISEVGREIGVALEVAHAVVDELLGVVGEFLVELVADAKLHQFAVGLFLQNDVRRQRALAGAEGVAIMLVAGDEPALIVEDDDGMADPVARLANPVSCWRMAPADT